MPASLPVRLPVWTASPRLLRQRRTDQGCMSLAALPGRAVLRSILIPLDSPCLLWCATPTHACQRLPPCRLPLAQEHADELALLETLDNGKTFSQAGVGAMWPTCKRRWPQRTTCNPVI